MYNESFHCPGTTHISVGGHPLHLACSTDTKNGILILSRDIVPYIRFTFGRSK
jgi:hypothetical protein